MTVAAAHVAMVHFALREGPVNMTSSICPSGKYSSSVSKLGSVLQPIRLRVGVIAHGGTPANARSTQFHQFA